MKPLSIKLLVAGAAAIPALALAVHTFAQTNNSPVAEKSKEASTNAAPALNEYEAKFKAMLDNATMAGRWCTVNDGQMSPDKEDKYSIVSVEKIGTEDWIIKAHIQYGQRDFVAPIPVKIRWAGDTAVLGVDKLPAPGGGVYTARVLFYDNIYSGTWSGGNHGGLLHGIITHTNN